MNKENEVQDSNTKDIFIGIGLFLLVFGFWYISWCYIDNKIYSDDKTIASSEAIRGQFGDKFGAINSLFSGLAFAGIIFTIFLQKRELSLQRQELKDTREELQRAADAQEKSEIALSRQAENLKISAKLSALNTLLNYYMNEEATFIKNGNYSDGFHNTKNKKQLYLTRIEKILEQKENS